MYFHSRIHHLLGLIQSHHMLRRTCWTTDAIKQQIGNMLISRLKMRLCSHHRPLCSAAAQDCHSFHWFQSYLGYSTIPTFQLCYEHLSVMNKLSICKYIFFNSATNLPCHYIKWPTSSTWTCGSCAEEPATQGPQQLWSGWSSLIYLTWWRPRLVPVHPCPLVRSSMDLQQFPVSSIAAGRLHAPTSGTTLQTHPCFPLCLLLQQGKYVPSFHLILSYQCFVLTVQEGSGFESKPRPVYSLLVLYLSAWVFSRYCRLP